MADFDDPLNAAAEQVARLLKQHGRRLVLSESCTGGLAAAALTAIPGISDYFCGSAVTYRNETKAGWLSVSRVDLDNPRIGPVSREVAAQMCLGVLKQTPEADLAAAITGHLGPSAPAEQDGLIWMGIINRADSLPRCESHLLSASAPNGVSLRSARRQEAARLLMCLIESELAS